MFDWQTQAIANVNLSRYNTWRVGGPAEWLFAPKDAAHLSQFLKAIPEDMPITWLGLGSNLLVRDGGIEGVVIQTHVGLKKFTETDAMVRIEAGMTCAKAARELSKLGYIGCEFLVGIPGTIGGALVMNAGAYQGETWSHVVAIDTIDRHGKITKHDARDFAVGYRTVQGLPEDEWVLAGYFNYPKGDIAKAQAQMKALLKRRGNEQPIGQPSCGSVFRNPPNHHAAKLIESCGLKGYRLGSARVSEKHANFIVHDGNAIAADIEQLILYIQAQVEAKYQIKLIPEVHIRGITQKVNA